MRMQPLLLRLELKYELEHAEYIVKPLARSIKRQYWKCLHGKRSLAFVVATDESSRDLVKRLGLADISGIEDYSCYVAPIGAVTLHGGLSSLHTALNNAWEHVGGRKHPQYRQQIQRFDRRHETRVDDREHGALRVRKPAALDGGKTLT